VESGHLVVQVRPRRVTPRFDAGRVYGPDRAFSPPAASRTRRSSSCARQRRGAVGPLTPHRTADRGQAMNDHRAQDRDVTIVRRGGTMGARGGGRRLPRADTRHDPGRRLKLVITSRSSYIDSHGARRDHPLLHDPHRGSVRASSCLASPHRASLLVIHAAAVDLRSVRPRSRGAKRLRQTGSG